MEDDSSNKRSEVRQPMQADTSVEALNSGQIARATTIDLSPSGALLNFSEGFSLVPGDHVTCDFVVTHDEVSALPYWGIGEVIRVDGTRVAIRLGSAGLSPIAPPEELIESGDTA